VLKALGLVEIGSSLDRRRINVAVVAGIAAAPVCVKAAANDTASSLSTPAGDQYFITWKMTARGHNGPSDNSGQFAYEATQTSASDGPADGDAP